MKKKILLLLLVLYLVGCGKKNDYESEDNYINASKKDVFVENIKLYINSARLEVNSAVNYKIYDNNTLYLVPAGSNDYSCIRGSESPYGEWKYLYIGVLYDDYSYKYYVIGEDEKGYGIPFISTDSLDKDSIYSKSRIKEDGYNILNELYNTKDDNQIYREIDGSSNYIKLTKILKTKNTNYNKIIVIGSKNCKS